ncbi:transposase [Streptomyces sp. NBC_00775]|uniref:transposase n=1 Tax=Streptomyces sp. NBC_00775 TaxID=2975828 RepID=UPI002ED27E15|nr:transposase [Streptomyces sp. NBC_00775]WUB32559.1 transposase [Streptomyces sp. NBC_00589]
MKLLPASAAEPSARGEQHERPARGRPRREVLAAIIFAVASGCTWRRLPPSIGPSGSTAHRRSARRWKFSTVVAGKGADSSRG